MINPSPLRLPTINHSIRQHRMPDYHDTWLSTTRAFESSRRGSVSVIDDFWMLQTSKLGFEELTMLFPNSFVKAFGLIKVQGLGFPPSLNKFVPPKCFFYNCYKLNPEACKILSRWVEICSFLSTSVLDLVLHCRSAKRVVGFAWPNEALHTTNIIQVVWRRKQQRADPSISHYVRATWCESRCRTHDAPSFFMNKETAEFSVEFRADSFLLHRNTHPSSYGLVCNTYSHPIL